MPHHHTNHDTATDAVVFRVGEITACLGIFCYLALLFLAYKVPRLRQHPETMVLYCSASGILFNVRGVIRPAIWNGLSGSKAQYEYKSFLLISDNCYFEVAWSMVRLPNNCHHFCLPRHFSLIVCAVLAVVAHDMELPVGC